MWRCPRRAVGTGDGPRGGRGRRRADSRFAPVGWFNSTGSRGGGRSVAPLVTLYPTPGTESCAGGSDCNNRTLFTSTAFPIFGVRRLRAAQVVRWSGMCARSFRRVDAVDGSPIVCGGTRPGSSPSARRWRGGSETRVWVISSRSSTTVSRARTGCRIGSIAREGFGLPGRRLRGGAVQPAGGAQGRRSISYVRHTVRTRNPRTCGS